MSKLNTQSFSNKEADVLKELTSSIQKADLILKKIEESTQSENLKGIVERIMEFNNGDSNITSSKITHYLRKKIKMTKTEANTTLNKISTQYMELVETRGKEKFYKILL